MRNYIFIVVALLLGASCQTKEEPDRQTGDPAFSIKGSVDGTPMEVDAGKNNYYMFSDYNVDSGSVIEFNGKLAQTNCTQCQPSLTIRIRNYRTGFQYSIDSALMIYDYEYLDPKGVDSNYYEISFISKPKGNGTPTHLWEFGNGQASTQQNPVVRYKDPGKYVVSYYVNYSGCLSLLSQTVSTTPGNNVDFNVNYITSRNLLFNRIPVDSSATVMWDFGDTTGGEGSIVNHEYRDPGIYKVCMLSYSGGSDTLTFCKNVSTGDTNTCMSNFTYHCELKQDANLHLSDVVIEWTDADGRKYSSDQISQAGFGSFTIRGVRGYVVNEKGQKTKQLDISFTCRVSDGAKIIELQNMEGTIAVAYP